MLPRDERATHLGASRFRRQVRIGCYIAGFASHRIKLIIEVDGGQHAVRTAADKERTRHLERHGYSVLRFWNNDVLGNIDGVLEEIQCAITATPPLSPPHKGEGKSKTTRPNPADRLPCVTVAA